MRSGTYYLNNRGDRWVVFVNGKRPRHTFTTKSGKTVVRSAIYYEAFGNHATIRINYKGKQISVFADTVLED